MVVIYFKSDSRIRVIVLVEDDPSVINAINDGLITGLLNGTGSYPFHAKENAAAGLGAMAFCALDSREIFFSCCL